MKWAWRAVLLLLAVVTPAAQAARLALLAPAPAPPLETRLAGLGLQPLAGENPESLAARAPGCAAPLMVVRLAFDGSGLTLSGPGDARFVYLGLVTRRLDWPLVLGRWAEAGGLAALGMRHAALPRELVMVRLPPGCPGLASLDWSRLSPWGG